MQSCLHLHQTGQETEAQGGDRIGPRSPKLDSQLEQPQLQNVSSSIRQECFLRARRGKKSGQLRLLIGVGAHYNNLGSQVLEAGELAIHSQHCLHNQFKASLSYKIPCLEKSTNTKKTGVI